MFKRWLPVVGFEELYEVSNMGHVRNKKGQILKTQVNRDGYAKIGFYVDGTKSYHVVHRLVAKAFIPNPEGKPQINHLDANRLNNRADNLEWCTHGENMHHAFVLGNKDQKGSKNNGAKITEGVVLAIRQKVAEGKLQKDIAAEYGLSKANVCLIVNRQTWKHI